MPRSAQHVSLSRQRLLALFALALLGVTVSGGLYIGVQTRAQFDEVEASWVDYSGRSERRGILISELRGHLGYGGLIHNFKNYVLRQDAVYLTLTRAGLQSFEATLQAFRALDLAPEDAAALETIAQTIAIYEARLPLAIAAAANDWPPDQTDSQVRVDDSAAIAALAGLERRWSAAQSASSERVLAAVSQGERLIRIGAVSIVALVLAALALAALLWLLIRGLHRAGAEAARELAAREQVERSEQRLAMAVEQSPATVLVTDTRARILYANARFETLTGWTRGEVLGRTPAFLQSGETGNEVYLALRKALSQGQTWHGILRNRKRDGTDYWSETTVLPLKGPDGKVANFIGFGEDVTERRSAREQIARAQKLEAVGLLAGGVAHDFNNILTTIVGASHLAALDAPEGSDLAGEIEQIDIAARRAQSLVRELLTFARREPGEKEAVRVGRIEEEVTRLLRASVPPIISFQAPDAATPVTVHTDPTHLHQILMNLGRNAAEAMGGGRGRIVFRHQTCRPPDGRDAGAHGWVEISVKDDGPGMSEQTRARLFEPFYTTKPLGKGSGLGLSVVYGLVEEVGGIINVESILGQGATFTLVLPGAGPEESARGGHAAPLPRGHERVLLVDDEQEVASAMRRVLLRLGYRVEAYSTPLAALDRMRQDQTCSDILISDMVMPEMSGTELAREIRALRPDIPVIFCSGYAPGRVSIPGPAPEMLTKPIEPAVLARHVRTQLDAAKVVKA